MVQNDFLISLVAGAAAGMAVDVSLFPLDTIKTRLQSSKGFWQTGGFRGIYSGFASVTLGSAPTAALFFCTYEVMKSVSLRRLDQHWAPVVQMGAASAGEVVACVIRVPVEVIKQRAQANPELSSLTLLRRTLAREGFIGLFRGYFSTVIREIPFSFIQMPVWEFLKVLLYKHQKTPVKPWQSSVCGAISGCFAAGLTTPLDVAKTRIMLAEVGSPLSSGSILLALRDVFRQQGIQGLFAGILPRMALISVGGAIFLGLYDKVKAVLSHKVPSDGYQ
ncbi:hypothetical protein CHS0354_027258 [Potamilus streckersoni]|uniref:S-adenosylmethionine transporter n=1 Tax=Potamilus streckersoni TaxID=2493646 RepID=A0AAE0VM55_9BIVA|nr:hypothetical protein CHS0354_027258 [Potamilus streckersoni]